MAHDQDRDSPIRISPTEARQGSPNKTNLRVLLVALAALIVAAIFLYGYFYSRDLPAVIGP
ncbi:MAG: hypothetical protein WC807_00705 [Hyphomicrobium sp.]|jgi:hypothetical protein